MKWIKYSRYTGDEADSVDLDRLAPDLQRRIGHETHLL